METIDEKIALPLEWFYLIALLECFLGAPFLQIREITSQKIKGPWHGLENLLAVILVRIRSYDLNPVVIVMEFLTGTDYRYLL